MKSFRPRLTYANVVSSIALFGVLAGGGAYAASKIGPNDIKNSAVKSRHIDGKAVKAADIALGAVSPGRLEGSEPIHMIGAPGQPQFGEGWSNGGEPAGFYKDMLGVVHLTGDVFATADADQTIFTLPPPWRPTSPTCTATVRAEDPIVSESAFVCALPSGAVQMHASSGDATFYLNGAAFRVGFG
jgi:hypothetical protein